MAERRARAPRETETAGHTIVARRRREPLRVRRLDADTWVVSGGNVERLAARFDSTNLEACRHLQEVFEQMGIMKELKDQGAKDGDALRIGKVELTYLE
jgi:GTP-binding protein